ncbi:chemotaxis protein CheW [Polyangium mundeleinium]|uniref:Chemotaxis protein CheW n=1 Tax=Polyangium mundeleinium TaxID=2995306 RepID=A0ABT5EPX9_9BACT|nr:chemotaxis protein CheW [Polyangium mundeleinium]MDC0742977.1 chemotaxis protein CheW [Polyangium mundeleinium]
MKARQENVATREEILKRRAERLAGTANDDGPRRIAARVALVGAATQRLGIPVEVLREIVPIPDITALPGLPRWLLGITHVRGEIVGVVDLASILGAGGERASAMAVVEGAGGPLGLAVESVLGFRDIHEDELSAQMKADSHRPIQAMTKDLIAIIDVERLPVAQGEGESPDLATRATTD